MTFIETVPEDQATGAVAAMYETDRQTFGHLPNLTKGFSLRPDVYAAWQQLNGAIKASMDLRRYELATLAAASRLRSSYCCLAHGSVLLDRFLGPEGVRAIVVGDDGAAAAELDAVDAAIVELAGKVALDATSVTQADVDRLRSLGLTDAEVLDVVLAASVRCFFSKALNGVGIEPDAGYAHLDGELRDLLTVGRPIAAR
ncbi:MAG: hypothetical protein QOH46_1018 [Solirubrobacteraceae bacterium]|nr:hypothetical protein [Solirubrobacteraceae bacterium]